MIIRLSISALLCLAIAHGAEAQTTGVSQSARRDAHRQLHQAITAWQHNDLVAARRLVDAALATGVPDEQFAISPQQLLKRIAQEEARLRREQEAALKQAANLAPPAPAAPPDFEGLSPVPTVPTEKDAAKPGESELTVSPLPIGESLATADPNPDSSSIPLTSESPSAAPASATSVTAAHRPATDARDGEDGVNLPLREDKSLPPALISRLPSVDEKNSMQRQSPLDWLATRTWKIDEDGKLREQPPEDLKDASHEPPLSSTALMNPTTVMVDSQSPGRLDVPSVPLPAALVEPSAELLETKSTAAPPPLVSVDAVGRHPQPQVAVATSDTTNSLMSPEGQVEVTQAPDISSLTAEGMEAPTNDLAANAETGAPFERATVVPVPVAATVVPPAALTSPFPDIHVASAPPGAAPTASGSAGFSTPPLADPSATAVNTLPTSEVALESGFAPPPPQAGQLSAPQMVAYGTAGPQAYPPRVSVDHRAFGRPGRAASQLLVVRPVTKLVRQGDSPPRVVPNVQSQPLENPSRNGRPTPHRQ